MLKTKLHHPKNNTHQKAKTLQSFCNYQSNRFNQATFKHNFQPDKHKLPIPLSQTDLKIQEIKKKYGIPPRNPQHQRYFSLSQNFTTSHPNSSNPKSALKERSMSTLTNHIPQKTINLISQKTINIISNNTINPIPQKTLRNSRKQPTRQALKQSRKQLKSSTVQNKQNIALKESSRIRLKQVTILNPKIDYNDTFSKQALKSTRNQIKQHKQPKVQPKESSRITEKNLEKSQALQSRRSKRMHKTQQDFWSNSYIPRLQNIEKINGKIRSALQNFEGFQKRDISISIGKTKVQKNEEPQLKVHKSPLENDLIETRVLQNIPCHRRKTSNFSTASDLNYLTPLRTEQNRNSPYVRIKTEANFSQRKETINDEKPIYNHEDNLFSRIKSLYKRSEEIQEKKAEIMDYSQKHMSLQKPSQNRFTPGTHQQLRSSSLTSDKIQKLQEIKNKYINKVSCRSTYTQNQGQKTDNRMNTVRKNRSPQKPSFNLIYVKEDKSESYGDQIQNFEQNQDKVNELYASQLEQIISLTKSGIETRKKTKQALQNPKLFQQNSNGKRSGSQDFCQMLKNQIELDENLRKVKYWFKYQTKGRKWDQINQQYSRLISKLQDSQQSRKISHSNWKLKFLFQKPVQSHFLNFEMLDEQIDPFFSLRVCQFTYKDLLQSYLESEMHWSNICKSGIFSKLVQINWITEADPDKKAYVNLTDLTRFMNFSSHSFFKNRDLALIFKRLTSDSPTKTYTDQEFHYSQALNFQQITQTLNLGVSHKKITIETLRRIDETSFNQV